MGSLCFPGAVMGNSYTLHYQLSWVTSLTSGRSMLGSFIRSWDSSGAHEVYRITAGTLSIGQELCIWSLLFLRQVKLPPS